MKMKIEFELDNSAFGDGHDDNQFGYAIDTALKRVGASYRGLTRREVGEEADHTGDSVVYDSNGNTVGTVEFEGYEPPVLTKSQKLGELFKSESLSDILEAMEKLTPDYKITVAMAVHDNALFTQLESDQKFTEAMVDDLIAEMA